jgi:hypothetical protein
MSDITTNSLRGLVKTLNDVVVPAIPADDPLALQELKMVVRYLGFCRERVEHLYARARFEVNFYAGLAGECGALLGTAAPAPSRELAALNERAQALLREPGAAIGTLRALAQETMTRLSRLLGEVGDAEALAQVERAIVRGSAELTAFDRSWYLPLKLDRFPGEVRPLSAFIPVHDAGH